MMEKLDKFDLKSEATKVTSEIRQQTLSYITAGLGVVAGLAWNDAIKTLIDFWFPLDKNSILARFIYAVIITVVVVLLTMYLVRILKKDEKKENKK